MDKQLNDSLKEAYQKTHDHRSHARTMEAQQSTGSPDSGSPSSSPVSSTSADGKLPSVQQILPSLLGLQGWSFGSTIGQSSQNPSQAHNNLMPRNASNAATQFLLANQALQGLQAQQFLQLPSSNASQQLMSVPVGAASQQMLVNNSQLLSSALVGLQSGNNPQNTQSGVALVNHFQMQQLLNNGLSSNQVLAALNNQFLATAAAQSGLQLAAAQSGLQQLGQSVIRRAGKSCSGSMDSSVKTGGNGGGGHMIKSEDTDEDGDEMSVNSENGGEDKDDRDHADRGPTIAQLTNTPGVIRSTRGAGFAQSTKSSFGTSIKKSASPPTSSSSPSSAPTSTSPANINNGRTRRHEKSVICTARSSSATNIVDGIDLEEIREFAKRFKMRRLSLGLTQTQVGQALSATEGPSYSQSAICRFEKLDITPRSAQKIKPVLERWMKEAEERYENGGQNLAEFVGCEPNKKRKRRTSFTPQALEILNVHFEKNTHPSGAEVTSLADELNYDREVVRVWFCNKRQALKNTIKKIKNSAS